MGSETEIEELRQQLERTQAQLDRTQGELASREKELGGARESVTRLEAELRTVGMEAELYKLRAVEALRTELDMERKQIRADREVELARFKEWKEELLAEKADLKRQVERYKKVRGSSGSGDEKSETSTSPTPVGLVSPASAATGGSDHTHASDDGHTPAGEDPAHDGGGDHTHSGEGGDSKDTDHSHAGGGDHTHSGEGGDSKDTDRTHVGGGDHTHSGEGGDSKDTDHAHDGDSRDTGHTPTEGIHPPVHRTLIDAHPTHEAVDPTVSETGISITSGAIPSNTEVVQSVARLLEAQRVMMEAQVQAMAAHSVPPLRKFSGEDFNTEDGSFDRWIEGFEERAKITGWNEEQRLFQLKAHLEKTAEHAVRMLTTKEKSGYASIVAALKKRFHSLDIEELRGLEFHQLMQDKQTVEEIGIRLQKLARKAFPESGPREFDRMLKGRFYQALLPKWQRKLGAPKATETFDDLYARARTLERHDQQFNARRGDTKPQSDRPQRLGPAKESKSTGLDHSPSGPPPRGAGKNFGRHKSKSGACYHCGESGHYGRDCPARGTEAAGKSSKVSALTARSAEDMTIPQLEELITSKRLAAEKAKIGQSTAEVGTVTSSISTSSEADRMNNEMDSFSGAVGPALYLEIKIEGYPVKALVDTGAQSTIVSRSLLHDIARHKKKQGRELPKLERPGVALYGRSGENSGALTITAQTEFEFSLSGRSVKSPVFIQPESEIHCLLGMNVLPRLGLQLVQTDGSPLTVDVVKHAATSRVSRVCLVGSTYLPSQKVTVLEAELNHPFSQDDTLVFEPDWKGLEGIGVELSDALLKQQPKGRVFIPAVNPQAISARLEPGLCVGSVTHISELELRACEPQPEIPPDAASTLTAEPAGVNAVGVAQSPERLTRLFDALQLEQRSLTAKEFEQLKELIRENADVFALDDSELGHTSVIQHHVDTGDHGPIKQVVRRVPFVYRDKIARMVTAMKEAGIIKPSSSPWASPVVLVPKKDGTTRFCIDYRRLNSVTKKDVYPLPRIDDILDTLGGASYFSSLDLAAGYWQVGLDDESAAKSAFITHQGLHEFVRMPFGMCNAPATFQRLMETVLAGLLWDSCFAYIDDLLVCSHTFQEHLEHLRQVFTRLRKAGLRLKAKKCLFLREEVPYLGHVVTKGGIKPDPAKTEKVQHYPVPVSVSHVRQFLGLASYYRRFVPEFSRIASPLHSLLKRNAVFCWTSDCQHAFDKLKSLLVGAPVLAYPQFDRPFILETDASVLGLGAVLAQEQTDGQVHPIAFSSRSLSVHERNYGITELETLGLVWAVKLFRPYILGHRCVVLTDHAACTSLLGSANPSSKLARWAMAIQELDLDIRHRSGKTNRVADALSRNPVPASSILHVTERPPESASCESDVGKLQRSDSELSPIFEYLEKDVLPADERQARRLAIERLNFEVIDGVLYYENPAIPGYWRIAVPKSLRLTLLRESHGGKFAGHFSERKIYATLRTKYWWKGMRADVRRYCRGCLICASRKGPGRAQRPQLQSIPVGGPFHMVGVDVLQLPPSFSGNKYAIVFMDYFTKWPEVFATSDQTAETIARLLVEHVISRHGVPEHLLSDRGPNFLSALLGEVMKLVGTAKINTSGYHPQCDGLVEKFNGTLTNMLSKSATKYRCDWDTHLPYLLFAYRVAVQESTQASPFYLLYGREARIPTESALTQPRTPYQVEFPDYCSELVANLSDAWALAHQNIEKAQKKQKRQYDKRATPLKLKVGDRVMVYFPNQVKGKAWKLARPYFGPYKVLSLTPTNAEVQLMNAPNDGSIFVSLDRVRLCYEEMTDDVWAGPSHRTPKRSQKATQPERRARGTTTRALESEALTQDRVGPVTRSMARKSQAPDN